MKIFLPCLFVVLASIAIADDLLVCDLLGDQVLRYDGTTGEFLGIFAAGPAIDGPEGITVGPDGNVYIASEYSGNVTKWSPSGAYLGEFVSSGEGGLAGEQDLEFGPDGNLYVMSHIALGSDSIWKFDGTTGEFLEMHGLGGAPGHTHGLSWRASDGDLYQGQLNGPYIVNHFDGATGSLEGVFTSNEKLAILNDILWGPDDDLYVSNPLIDGMSIGGIIRFDGETGDYLGVFSSVGAPASTWGMVFKGEYLYYTVGSGVARVLASTGGTPSVFVSPGSGGLSSASSITFVIPEPASIITLGLGLAFLVGKRRHRR